MGTKVKSPNSNKINVKNVDVETERALNDLNEQATSIVEGFISRIYSQDILKDVTVQQLQTYLANPDQYVNELSNLAMYYYISDGDVFQLFDIVRTLPTLNYKIDTYDKKSKSYTSNLNKCIKALNKVSHKQLTRDIISQLTSVGTLVGIWLGDSKNPYLYVFDDLKYFFPRYRLYGKWVVSVDLTFLDSLDDFKKDIFFKNLSPYVTKEQYEKYSKGGNPDDRYIDLPLDRSVCLRTHTLRFSQPYGINWSTVGLYDIKHKKKLKDLEKAVANKIISAIAVLTIGSEKDPDKYGNLHLGKELKKKIFKGVKSALDKNEADGVSVISIPEFADLKFPDMKSDSLDPEKFESINYDITSDYGTSSALTNGSGANYSSAKINLETIYKKVGAVLELIEIEVYNKLFNIVLPNNAQDEYVLNYDKEVPISQKEKIEFLFKLHSEGFAIKPIIDNLNGVDFDEFVQQSIFELDELKLSEKIQPYQSSFTQSGGSDSGTKPTNDNPDNESTISTKSNDGNSLPS